MDAVATPEVKGVPPGLTAEPLDQHSGSVRGVPEGLIAEPLTAGATKEALAAVPKTFHSIKLKELPPEKPQAQPQAQVQGVPQGLTAHPVAQGTLSANHPSQWQNLKSAFGRTQTGQIVESNLDQLGRMLKNTHEKMSNPGGATDAEWEQTRKEQTAFFEKHLGQGPAKLAEGVSELGESFASPDQMLLMAGTLGESGLVQVAQKVGIPGAVTAAKTLAKLAQVQFSAQMIEGTATGIENTVHSAINGDWWGAGAAAINGLVSGVMARGLVTHEVASEKVHRDLNATTAQMYRGKTFDQLNPYDQGIVIDQTVRNSPEYSATLKTADEQQEKGRDDSRKQRHKRLKQYYSTAVAKSWNPDAAQRTVDGIVRAADEDDRHEAIKKVVSTIHEANRIRTEEDQAWAGRRAEQEEEDRAAAREERPESRQRVSAARTAREKLANKVQEQRDAIYAERKEAQQAPSDIAQREVEVVESADKTLTYPANYYGEENSFGVTGDVMGHGVYRQTPRGVEWLDRNGNFVEEPGDALFTHPDPDTADTLARLSSLSTTADGLAEAEGATDAQKADAEYLARVRRELVSGEIDAREAQRQAGIAEKVTVSDAHTAAREGQLTGPFHESSAREYQEKLESSIRNAMEEGDTGWEEEDVQGVLDESMSLARRETENALHHVYQPGDYIVSKRGVKWTLDAKGMLHPDDGGPAHPLMRDGLYSGPAIQLAETGRIGYGTRTREQRRLDAAKRREVDESVRLSQDEVANEMRLAKQAEGLQTAAAAEPRGDQAAKQAREQRMLSRPPRPAESPESQIVRMIFQAPSTPGSVIQAIARAKQVTPEEVMRRSLATDPAMSGTPEQKIAGLEPGDRIVEPIRKKPWVVETGKDGQTYLRSGNAQPIKLDRLNPSEAVKGIIGRGEIEKDQEPGDAERVAFENPHYARWQDEQVADVEELAKKPAPEPKTEKQAKVQVQATERRAAAALSAATKKTLEAIDPKTDSVEQAEKQVEDAEAAVKTAEEAYAQSVEAKSNLEPKDEFPQKAPVSIGLRGEGGTIVQNGREVPFHYELVPIDALTTSHEWNGKAMAENPGYPSELQPRTISDSEAAQNALRAERGTYDFRQYADKTINGSMGPAIVDAGGQVVGGNTRLAILRKHLSILEATPDVEEREAVMAGMKARMRQLALESGIARYPEDGKMYVVVRMMDHPIETTREAAELGRLFNKKIGVEISKAAKGVSYSKSLDKAVLQEIGRLVDAHDSIAAAITKEPDFFNQIVSDRFDVGAEEEADWFREVGNDQIRQKILSEDGRNQFEKAVLGVFVRDASILNKLQGKTPFIALQRALSYMVKMLGMPHLDITWKISEAMRAAAETDGTNPGLSQHSDEWHATYRPDQQDFLGMETAIPPEPDRMTEVLWRALQGGNRTLNDRLKSYIGEESAAAISMFEAHQETPVEAFNRAFRKEFTGAEHLRKDGIKEITPEQFEAAVKGLPLGDIQAGEGGTRPEQAGRQETAAPQKPEEAKKPPSAITRPPKTKDAITALGEAKAAKGYVTPEALKTFLETSPATRDHAAELLRTAKMMAEYVYDADPPVGTERKDALDWVLRERLAGIENGELKSARGHYSDPNIEKGMGDAILRLHKAADPTTFIHEFAHVIFPLLSDGDMRVMNRIIGDEKRPMAEWDGQRGTLKGEAYKAVSEKFAHGLERFLRDENPTGFTHEVKAVLAKVKDIMRKVYLAFKSDPLGDFHVGEAQREVFAKMFGVTDFDVADTWRDEVKKARAEEARLKRPSEEKHPLVKLASEMGGQGIRKTFAGKVEDTIGGRVDPRKPEATIAFNKEDAVMAAWATLPKGKIQNAELIAGDGEWGIRFNTQSKLPPDILQQGLPERHPGLELEDMEKRLKETPTFKIMERKLLQLRIDNLKNRIRAEHGAEEENQKSDPELLKAVKEEVQRGKADSVRKAADGVSRDSRPEGVGGVSKPPLPRLPRNAGARGERGGASREPVARVTSLADVKPVELQPLAKERGAPVEGFDSKKWADALKAAGLPETLPPPTYELDPRVAQVLKFPGQKQIVQTVMSALEQGDGAILASSTGSGKTFTSMATIREFRNQNPEAKILHITKNRGLLKDAAKVAANSFGMELEKDVPDSPEVEAGVYGTTYVGMLNNKIYSQIPWDMVIADEAGEARNWFRDENKQGKRLMDVVNNAKKAVYVSATPFHSPNEYGYLTKLNLWPKGQFDKWIQANFAHEKIGDKVVARLDPAKQAKLRQQLIERGQLVSQSISYEGFNAHFGVVPVTDSMKRSLDRIREGFARARSQFVQMGKKGMAEKTAAFEATYTKAFLERERIPQAIELARKARDKGWRVMIFSETSAEDLFRRERSADIDPSTYQMLDDAMGGQLSKIIPPFEDVYDALRAEFGPEIVDYSGRGNTMASRDAAKTDFLTGKAPMLYTTYAAGGIGVSLHDADYPDLNVTGGDKPRVAIYLGPPYSGVLLEQAMGRPWRFGTKSDVHAVFLATDSEPDIRLMQTKIGPRMRALRAAVHGEKDSLANVMQTYTDEQKVRERQEALAYAEGDEVKVTAANYQVRSKGRDVGINNWSQIEFPPAQDAMHRGMKYGEAVGGETWSNLFQSKPDGMERPQDVRAKKIIDGMANAAVSGKQPLLAGMEPADRETATAVSAAMATSEVGLPAERDKDNAARQAMEANLRENALINYHGLMLSQEMGILNIARMQEKAVVGHDLVRMSRSFRADHDLSLAQYWNLLEDAMKRHGYPVDKNMPLNDLWDVVEGKKVSADPKVMGLAADVADMMAIVHDDAAKAGVTLRTKAGEKVSYKDFPRDPHYMKHRIDWDYEMVDPQTNERIKVRDFLKKDEQQQQRILDSIPELKPYSRKQVLDHLRRSDPRVPRQSSMNYAREVNFPFIVKDYSTLLGYFDEAATAIAAAKNFGPESEHLNGQIDKIDDVRANATLKSMFHAALEPQDWTGATGTLYKAAVTYEAASKMTFSAFKVPFHLVLGPVALKGRVMPHIRAMGRMAMHPKEVMERATFAGSVVRQTNTAEMLFGERMNSPVRQILRKEMFEGAYRIVRAISSESARVYLDQYAIRDLKKGGAGAANARRMLKDVFLIGDKGINDAIRNGRFGEEDTLKAQTAFTNMAAFSGDPMQMPGMARREMTATSSRGDLALNRALRLTYALQSFSVKATSLLREHLWDEVMIHGNKKPLMYAMIAFPAVGTLLNLTGTGVKHAVKKGFEGASDKIAAMTGHPHAKRKDSKDSWDNYIDSLKDTVEHPEAVKFLKWYVDSLTLACGAELLKTLADPLFNMAAGKPAKADLYWREDVAEHVVGPFFSDLWKLGEEVSNLQKIHSGKTHPEQKWGKAKKSMLKFATDEVPALRQLPWVNDRLQQGNKNPFLAPKSYHATEVEHEDAHAEIPPAIERIAKALNVRTVPGGRLAGYGNGEAIASVGENDPSGRVEINDPARFAQGPKQILGHEIFHVWRRNLPGATQQRALPIDTGNPYDLSDVDELRRQGVTLATIPEEKGGEIVQAYIARPEMRRKLQPWIDDMEREGMSLIQATDPQAAQLNTTPRTPLAPF